MTLLYILETIHTLQGVRNMGKSMKIVIDRGQVVQDWSGPPHLPLGRLLWVNITEFFRGPHMTSKVSSTRNCENHGPEGDPQLLESLKQVLGFYVAS